MKAYDGVPVDLVDLVGDLDDGAGVGIGRPVVGQDDLEQGRDGDGLSGLYAAGGPDGCEGEGNSEEALHDDDLLLVSHRGAQSAARHSTPKVSATSGRPRRATCWPANRTTGSGKAKLARTAA